MFHTILKPEALDPKQDATRSIVFARLALLVAVSLIFALSGPFGTFQQGDLADRLFYWFVLNAVSVFIAVAVKGCVNKFLSHFGFLTRETVTILMVTVIFTPFLWYWTMSMFPGLIASPPSLSWLAGAVLAICVALSILFHGIPLVIGLAGPAPISSHVSARIVRRLPETFAGKIIHLEVDGHIVQVVTDEGRFDLRMRFADAVEEVTELDGFYTHRSHWVVRSEILEIRTVNNRPCLFLSNGDEVPVSRKYQPHLEAIGVL